MTEQAALLRKLDQDSVDEAMRKALAPDRALLLTGRGTIAKGDVPGHEFRGNQYSGPLAVSGGKTEYSVTTITTSGRPEKAKKKEAFEHANALKAAGHSDVKVTRRMNVHTIPGSGIGSTTVYTVHHGTAPVSDGSRLSPTTRSSTRSASNQ